MKFIVVGRNQFATMDLPEVPHVIVAINDPQESPVFKWGDKTLVRTNHFFSDIDREIDQNDPRPFIGAQRVNGKYVLATDVDARKIVDAVRLGLEAGAECVVVHCGAGVSRSAGVAAALSKAINGTDDEYFGDRSRFVPNRLVYRKVLEAWHGD